jgi:hypothetical protein
MRSGLTVATVAVVAGMLASTALSSATSIPVGPPVALGPHALAVAMERNPEIATYVQRRGYPDWVERIEVDSAHPLATHEIHLYYLRLDKEIAFTRADILGHPYIGLRKYERPLAPAIRERIAGYYLAHDPARRAELAAGRAQDAAERAERAAAVVEDAADRATRVANEMEQSFTKRLRK